MDVSLSENHLMIQQMVREFAAKEIAPYSARWDENEEFPADVIRKLGEFGITGNPTLTVALARLLPPAVKGQRAARSAGVEPRG